jgi:serine protease
MKLTGTAVFVLACMLSLQAQVKSPFYTLPQGVTQNDLVSGRVVVKVKQQYKAAFASGLSTARTSLRTTAIKPLSSGNTAASHTSRARAFKPAIDISLYYEIKFDPSVAVEDFLNSVYETGFVEYAEPVYREQMMFTPNDTFVASQYELSLINAFEAWDITQGNEEIIIAVVDSGVDKDHADLAGQFYLNDDPINGIDDDNNGFIDDISGWDFSGDDVNNIYDPDFKGDNDPAIFKFGKGFTHGTSVGSLAAGTTNDNNGMAGIAFKSKLMFLKHFADNQEDDSRTYNSNLYLGVLYAAENGARIINCSWGSTVRSQINQDIMTHVTLDLGCMVVAAAGNSNNAVPLYPAAYDYTLSVASTDQNDKRATFSSYGATVDIVAPGVDLIVAEFGGYDFTGNGTSFSAPIVAGAAALLLSIHPEYTPLQLAEQLRVTADASMYTQNPTYVNQLGKGRLDIHKALTFESPSVRAHNYKFVNENNLTAEPGQHALLSFDFTNHLKATSAALSISISTSSPFVAITKSIFSPGAIGAGATVNNRSTPFELDIANNVPQNTSIDIVINYSDGDYNDFQVFSFVPNPSYRNIDDNLITTTISSSGRLGYENTASSTGGNGFLFNNISMLYEMGLIMGGSSASILNTVRNASGGYDNDFVSTSSIREIFPGERSYAEVFGDLSNSTTAAEQKVQVNYRSMVWRESPYDKFVILEYKIKNPQATALTNFHFGIFADWDISAGGSTDAAHWDPQTKLGYVAPKLSSSLPQAGIQLLSGNGNYYAIDNDGSIAGNPFGIYDGYTDAEKFTTISTDRLQAGNVTATGNDVSHVISAGPYTINAGEEITIAFALHGANNTDELITSAKYADSLYNFTLQAPRPVVDTIETCYGANALLTATGASSFHWYADFTGGEPLFSGSEFLVGNLFSDTTFFVSNADQSYESVRTPAFISVKAKPQIIAEGPTTICNGGNVVLKVDSATSYLWNNALTTRSITITEPGDYSVVVKYVTEEINCESTSNVITIDELPGPMSSFSFTGGDIFAGSPIQFTDESTDATSWKWDFGDGDISTDQNPQHTFDTGGSFNVTLTVTNANGCNDVSSNNVAIITGVEGQLSSMITVHPNPSRQDKITITVEGISAQILELKLMNSHGQEVRREEFKNIQEHFSTTLPATQYPPGMYLLLMKADNRIAVKKVVISR